MEITEIFYSIQGEGMLSGTPTIFIRFYGCNLDCKWCDEPLHKIQKESMDTKDILEVIEKYPCKHITITGGEPSVNNINKFIKILQEKGYFVAVETNGFKLNNIKDADHITYSPKTAQIHKNPLITEYKVVIGKNDNIAHLKEFKNVYIQPMSDGDDLNIDNILYCAKEVMKYPTMKLSIQTHKVYNGR